MLALSCHSAVLMGNPRSEAWDSIWHKKSEDNPVWLKIYTFLTGDRCVFDGHESAQEEATCLSLLFSFTQTPQFMMKFRFGSLQTVVQSKYHKLILSLEEWDNMCLTWRKKELETDSNTQLHRKHIFRGFSLSKLAAFNSKCCTCYYICMYLSWVEFKLSWLQTERQTKR